MFSDSEKGLVKNDSSSIGFSILQQFCAQGHAKLLADLQKHEGNYFKILGFAGKGLHTFYSQISLKLYKIIAYGKTEHTAHDLSND